ncbi:MAG: GNAT family N-acetyltransferase [Christensenellales bacterium]|jgi:diamine N-acetyltransferase
MIELRNITEDNFHDCIHLKASIANESFVDPVVYSLAEAWLDYPNTKPFAIYKGDKLIGFVSIYVCKENCQIINFFIDDAFQNKGYGTAAVKVCVHYLKEEYQAKVVLVPVELENTAAQKFWQKFGFQFSDSIEDGYVFMRLLLLSF